MDYRRRVDESSTHGVTPPPGLAIPPRPPAPPPPPSPAPANSRALVWAVVGVVAFVGICLAAWAVGSRGDDAGETVDGVQQFRESMVDGMVEEFEASGMTADRACILEAMEPFTNAELVAMFTAPDDEEPTPEADDFYERVFECIDA